jgi:hypothetical protein
VLKRQFTFFAGWQVIPSFHRKMEFYEFKRKDFLKIGDPALRKYLAFSMVVWYILTRHLI